MHRKNVYEPVFSLCLCVCFLYFLFSFLSLPGPGGHNARASWWHKFWSRTTCGKQGSVWHCMFAQGATPGICFNVFLDLLSYFDCFLFHILLCLTLPLRLFSLSIILCASLFLFFYSYHFSCCIVYCFPFLFIHHLSYFVVFMLYALYWFCFIFFYCTRSCTRHIFPRKVLQY